LANATEERVEACAKRGGGEDGQGREGFSYPFSVASKWKANDVKGKKLKFGGEAV